MSDSLLSHILEPLSVSLFFNEYYESQHLLIQNRSNRHYDSILTKDDIAAFFGLERIQFYDLLVTRNQQSDIKNWTHFEPAKALQLDKNKVLSALQKGHSLILHSLQNYIPKLNKALFQVSNDFQSLVNVNVYISPPGSQALIPHIDYHDVFVLQIFGTKDWSLYEHPDKLPNESFFSKGQNKNIKTPSEEFQLSPGDLLYMPRGIRHAAKTSGQYSIHMTLSVHPVKYVDILTESLTRIRSSDLLRRSFPFNETKERKEELLTGLKAILHDWADNTSKEALVEIAIQKIRNKKNVDFQNRFEDLIELESICEDDFIIAPHAELNQIKKDGIFVAIHTHQDMRYSYPIILEETIKSALSGEQIIIKELKGPLDIKNKIKLVKKLITQGLVSVAKN